MGGKIGNERRRCDITRPRLVKECGSEPGACEFHHIKPRFFERDPDHLKLTLAQGLWDLEALPGVGGIKH
jgi:hypothetical protein